MIHWIETNRIRFGAYVKRANYKGLLLIMAKTKRNIGLAMYDGAEYYQTQHKDQVEVEAFIRFYLARKQQRVARPAK